MDSRLGPSFETSSNSEKRFRRRPRIPDICSSSEHRIFAAPLRCHPQLDCCSTIAHTSLSRPTSDRYEGQRDLRFSKKWLKNVSYSSLIWDVRYVVASDRL